MVAGFDTSFLGGDYILGFRERIVLQTIEEIDHLFVERMSLFQLIGAWCRGS